METPDAEVPALDDKVEADRHQQFLLLYTRSHAALFSYILSLLPNWSDAEDILQQTCLVLWQKFAEFEPGTDFVAWSCSIARYKVLNSLRARGRDRHVFATDVLERLADEGLVDVQRLDAERKALNYCLQKLPPDERDLVHTCYDVGASIKRVAEHLGRSPNSCYKLLNRIRESLLRCVEARLAEAVSP